MDDIIKLFNHSNHLGAFNTFTYTDKSGLLHFSQNIQEIINNYPDILTINLSSIIGVLSKNYMLGDTTLINGIYRSPWMGYPDKSKSQWLFYDVPNHKENFESKEKVAEKLFNLLCEEIIEYVGDKKKIGVLLSGGMDSRILVGCLNHLITNNTIKIDEVIGFTWGLERSRDVEYSKRITTSLNWKWKHYNVSANDLWENYKIAGVRGCEYSGIHLHAISKIAKDSDLVDVFLAGSYGDSVGRGEYSGMTVLKLKPIHSGINNSDRLLCNSLYNKSKSYINNEIEKYHMLFPREKKYMRNELDYQLHYMRRMLNPCMELINERRKLHQIFTNPKVFGYIWSLDPSIRDNDIYYNILKMFPPEISDVPWARTGKRYGYDNDTPDDYTKKHHEYDVIIQKDHLDRIQDFINENKNYLPFFNLKAVNCILNEIRKYPYGNFDYLEKITWIISFIHFIKVHEERINLEGDITSGSVSDVVKAKINYYLHTRTRSLKNRFR
ncbi:hypothetical protein GCM10007424_10070 [Flavobacterium suaedae]|uniref:asparagine synthase (glutamine-hydrolyzing) n=1 Tax=Flavobacterium suaedae TaxID=1767027 RepID=A0ABQ1JQI2_9FLAO|nr:asparagine synthase-related protein [Flavobacterium suaedae]GGB72071.1 hypothetical protein GCM10007424_10070 [Flavobacterium suaedae]